MFSWTAFVSNDSAGKEISREKREKNVLLWAMSNPRKRRFKRSVLRSEDRRRLIEYEHSPLINCLVSRLRMTGERIEKMPKIGSDTAISLGCGVLG